MTLPETREMLDLAQRLMWFTEPEPALKQPYSFLAQVMTYGTVEDVLKVQKIVGIDGFREALLNASPGVFDHRSWAFWNLKTGSWPAPPLPSRYFQNL